MIQAQEKKQKQTRQRKIDRPLKLYTYGRLQLFQLYQEKKQTKTLKLVKLSHWRNSNLAAELFIALRQLFSRWWMNVLVLAMDLNVAVDNVNHSPPPHLAQKHQMSQTLDSASHIIFSLDPTSSLSAQLTLQKFLDIHKVIGIGQVCKVFTCKIKNGCFYFTLG